MCRLSITTVLSVLLVLGTGARGDAASITLGTFANTSVPPGFSDQDNLGLALKSSTNTTLTSAVTGTFVDRNLSASATVTSGVSVNVVGGTLKLGGTSSAIGNTSMAAGGPFGAFSSSTGASAGINLFDQLSVMGGPATGSLRLNFDISGTLSTATSGGAPFSDSAAAQSTFFVNTDANPDNVLSANIQSLSGLGGNTESAVAGFPATWSVLVPYTNSSSNLFLHLGLSVGTSDACLGSCTENATAALADTFILSYIQILDGSGFIVPDSYALGDSGIRYNNVLLDPGTDPVPVPEPASLLLLSTGVIGAGLRRYRRGKRQHTALRTAIQKGQAGFSHSMTRNHGTRE
jgi:hypothetical protein